MDLDCTDLDLDCTDLALDCTDLDFRPYRLGLRLYRLRLYRLRLYRLRLYRLRLYRLGLRLYKLGLRLYRLGLYRLRFQILQPVFRMYLSPRFFLLFFRTVLFDLDSAAHALSTMAKVCEIMLIACRSNKNNTCLWSRTQDDAVCFRENKNTIDITAK